MLGLKPRLPAALDVGQPVAHVTVGEYTDRLGRYFKESYAEVQRIQRELVEKKEEDVTGYLSAELQVGDVVLVRRDALSTRTGPLRFQPRTYPDLYRVRKKICRRTFVVGLLTDPGAAVSFKQPVHAERLVKMDLPALGLDPGQPRRLEVHNAESDEWILHEIDRFAIDGRVLLRRVDPPGRGVWTDLSEQRYRWVVGTRVGERAASESVVA